MLSAAARAENPAKLVEELLPRVTKVMGLPGPRHLTVKVLSRAQAEAWLRAEPDVDRQQRLGEALLAVGLLPPGTKLEALAPDFNRQNVSGFYDLRTHTLVLLADQSDEAQRPIVAHELAHAVQDASLDLDAALKARRGSEDATLAFTAMLEGQAQATAALVMEQWLTDQHVTIEGMAGLLSDTTARSAAEAAAHAPVPWLGLQLSFPYVGGRELIAQVSTPDDPIGRFLLKAPPASTAQVRSPRAAPPLEGELHLERLVPGAKKSVSTTLGRANLELLGEDLGVGWRGDRLEAVRVRGKTIVTWSIAFETPAQAKQLAALVTGSLTRGTVVVISSGASQPLREAALRVF
jgi:hypothetical protein